jgi:hypothetical protein
MSSVNIAEVADILLDSDMKAEECKELIEPFIDSIIVFNDEHIYFTGYLKKLLSI